MQSEIDRLGSLAIQQLNSGNPEQAKKYILKILEINPAEINALKIYSYILLENGELESAIAALTKASEINANDSEIVFNLGKACFDIKSYEKAISYFQKNIEVSGAKPEVLVDIGIAFRYLKKYHESEENFKKALDLNQNYLPALNNLAITLMEKKDFNGALKSLNQALIISPRDIVALTNQGCIFSHLHRYDEALEILEKVLTISPHSIEALVNFANVLVFKKKFTGAISIYSQIAEMEPSKIENWVNLGSVYSKLRQYGQAQIALDKGGAIDPEHNYLLGQRLQVRAFLCNWDEAYYEFVKKLLTSKKYSLSEPFHHLYCHDNLSIHQQTAAFFSQKLCLPKGIHREFKNFTHQKIRVGYYSADFRDHPVAFLTAELFELHDKNKFEIFAFSFSGHDNSPIRSRLKSAFNQFIDVSGMSDLEVAQLSRELEIDIAVDLGGYTNDSRTGIFAYRAAPIQINYLGYPGTMGADYIDYIVADKTLIPENSQQFYSEKIIYLPNTYQVNDRKRAIADKQFTREELGLPERGFVFCCFNNSYKILPEIFASWMRILKAVEGSVLWLFEDNIWAVENLKKEASNSGVDPSRLVFAKRSPLSDHLARHSQADLFIDTWPYNAHTTASDALWSGLPVLTLMGQSFASRVAASLLNAIGLPELITNSLAEYEALAIELATNPKKLDTLKTTLAKNRLSTPLFDTPLFTKNLEAAYMRIYEGTPDEKPLKNIA